LNVERYFSPACLGGLDRMAAARWDDYGLDRRLVLAFPARTDQRVPALPVGGLDQESARSVPLPGRTRSDWAVQAGKGQMARRRFWVG